MFKDYKLGKELTDSLEMLGYIEPTPVQEKVIPYILSGKNVIAKSQTGSGKTAAFGIPLCEKIIWEENSPQALVLEPTRELACQVRDEIFNIGRFKRIKVPVLYGGFPFEKQVRTLKQKSHIVVGTPGRVLDHLEKDVLQPDNIRYLVIDEADLMFDMGFFEDVKKIMEYLPENKKIFLFSATIGENVTKLKESFIKDAEEVSIEGDTETADGIEHLIYETDNEEKPELLLNLFIAENPESAMVFCGTREMVNVLCRRLQRERIRCAMLHGLMEQKERTQSIDNFRDGRYRYLVATDVAARGVDFEKITHVINYDFPTSAQTYVHRAGRTGRNGCSGKAVSFVTDDDKRALQAVREYTKTELNINKSKIAEDYSEKEWEEKRREFFKVQKEKIELKKRKGAVFNKQIMKLSIGGGKKSKMRAGDIVGAVCSLEGLCADDIGIIDVRDSLTYVEILNGKGQLVIDGLQDKNIKGKVRKVRKSR